CIDKCSSVELTTTIVSMFLWYRRLALTIMYFADVSSNGDLLSSAWFTRSWTLQELLAPQRVLFYHKSGPSTRACGNSPNRSYTQSNRQRT
ncbi:hypothetical protein J3A83DRAFT_4098508, partial [Scleroderma citrinum]